MFSRNFGTSRKYVTLSQIVMTRRVMICLLMNGDKYIEHSYIILIGDTKNNICYY